MCVNCDRGYLSARILHYAANKIWMLTTMASFISKGPGDNPISCVPAVLPAQSSGTPGCEEPAASSGTGGPLVDSVRITEHSRSAHGPGMCGTGDNTTRDTGNNLGNTPLLKKQTKPTPKRTQLKSPAKSIKGGIFWNVKRLEFAPENDI